MCGCDNFDTYTFYSVTMSDVPDQDLVLQYIEDFYSYSDIDVWEQDPATADFIAHFEDIVRNCICEDRAAMTACEVVHCDDEAA